MFRLSWQRGVSAASNSRRSCSSWRCITRQLSQARSAAAAAAQQLVTRPIDKLLIANRGEIACRIISTARRLGIRTVAVYSDADRHARHVAMADEAVCVGPAPVHQSYLCGERVLAAARHTAATAIHPGYGLLSENAAFASACCAAGVVFVGPPPAAISDMGVKSTSKAIMLAAGVPVISGYHGDDQSDARLLQEADTIGYPVMIKAVMGGGGKGMRIAMNQEEFLPQLESARREAIKAFGDQAMLLERFVARPRHVEVQVLGDTHGNCLYLWERDCSVQRRHQKVIEEAPAPGVCAAVRRRLGETAVRAARAVHYVGAGTVEFIMDTTTTTTSSSSSSGDGGDQFYFMEMNTRLQVEHPVTEMITGLDLVEWQLRVAGGEALPITQDQVQLHGHAFEARIYAEDPGNNFMPGAGLLRHLSAPQPSPHVRIETGVRSGDEVSVHYDPMIAKLVVWSQDRRTALLKLRQSLAEYAVVGVATNVNFLISLAGHPEFGAGCVDTDFIQRHGQSLLPPPAAPTHAQLCQAAMAMLMSRDTGNTSISSPTSAAHQSPYLVCSDARFNYTLRREMALVAHDTDQTYTVVIETNRSSSAAAAHSYTLTIGDQLYQVSAHVERPLQSPTEQQSTVGSLAPPPPPLALLHLTCNIDGHITRLRCVPDGDSVHLFSETGMSTFRLPLRCHDTTNSTNVGRAGTIDGATGAVAPMPGVIDKLLVDVGDRVTFGQPLVVVIAMKMEYVIKSTGEGIVEKINYQVGDNVARGASLVKLQLTPPSSDKSDN